MLKWSNKRDRYENSTHTNVIRGNQASSYGHWLYVVCVNGTRILNNTYYSSTTCKHQYDAFNHFNGNFDIIINDSTASLSNPDEIKIDLLAKFEELKAKVKSPRTRKSTNMRRIEEMAIILDTINKLTECEFFKGV